MNYYILKERYEFTYILIQNKKFSFFKQHDLWKFKKLLTKLFEYPETIRNFRALANELFYLENLIKAVRQYEISLFF